MAIEIIPKPKTRKKLAVSFINIAYYGVVSLFFIVFIGYGFSFIFEKNMNDQLKELGLLIQEKRNPETQALEQGILDFNEKLTAFKSAFDSYRKPSKFFGFLSPICHEKVFFSRTNLDVGESKALLYGNTQSFKTLKEQMLIFDGQELIDDIDLTGISILEQGGVSFDASFVLKTQVFK